MDTKVRVPFIFYWLKKTTLRKEFCVSSSPRSLGVLGSVHLLPFRFFGIKLLGRRHLERVSFSSHVVELSNQMEIRRQTWGKECQFTYQSHKDERPCWKVWQRTRSKLSRVSTILLGVCEGRPDHMVGRPKGFPTTTKQIHDKQCNLEQTSLQHGRNPQETPALFATHA